jgi:hypothetical protein
MNTVFHYILDAEAEAPTGDVFDSPGNVSAFLSGSVSSFFSALRQNDRPALQKICWNIFQHYGKAHFDAAVAMVRGGVVSTVVSDLEALGDVDVPFVKRRLVLVRDDDELRYPFHLGTIAATTWLMRAHDPSVYIVAADPDLYPTLEAAPCTPAQLSGAPELLISGSIFDATIDEQPDGVLALAKSLLVSPYRFEGRAKIVFVSRSVHAQLTAQLSKEDAVVTEASELLVDATALRT